MTEATYPPGPRRRGRGRQARLPITSVVVAWTLAMFTPTLTFAAPVAAKVAGASPTGGTAVRSCESMIDLRLPGRTVESATSVGATEELPAYCDVQLTVTDPASDESFRVGVFLPSATWNGRFVGTGGGGFVGGGPDEPCGRYDPCSLADGYATANTDAGVPTTNNQGEFALNPDNTLNKPVVDIWNHLSIHQTAVSAKKVITAYYGKGPAYSYFYGGSAGGRQAMMEAQRYPHDYDGLAVFWPALNLSRLLPASLWPQVVMNVAGHFIPQSTFEAVNDRAIARCDGRDGVHDRIVSDWRACGFDARTLIGDVLTAREADIIDKIWKGPRGTDGRFLWYGPPPGTPLGRMAGTVTDEDGTTSPQPRTDALTWVTHWVLQDPDFDWRTLTYEKFADVFERSVAKWERTVDAADPDLSAFRAAGGRMVITHGTFDGSIPVQGTVDYYNRVADRMGGIREVQDFARLFLAPGGGHETLIRSHPHPGLMPAGYYGGLPSPGSALEAVVNWVEKKRKPMTLLGVGEGSTGETGMKRPLCVYPLAARYKGHGNTNDADNFRCAAR
ncbi:tannase/feruloyl esterase family alpha/beta hydrolase [Streptomyces sp. DH41]|uniref:tannase/feruloyl esterase family alpha/beta hydrolase n=1 Tax=Streptomyces sp. DH41 TaxID=3040125 RepID=UPI00244116D0|nr:tannase/feruloyl esterase family alpha/beta hydrolase [Streptomyces sp. DH41]MDG9723570.1 tannase/feruloyl esterase family alpha/beta hydrolase [Streptomyces sp. DH41]